MPSICIGGPFMILSVSRLGFLVLSLSNRIKPLEGVLGDCESLPIGDISCIL